MDLVLKYYPDIDVLVIELGKDGIVNEEWLGNDIVVGYSENKRIARIEIRYASKRGLVNIVKELAKTRRNPLEHTKNYPHINYK